MKKTHIFLLLFLLFGSISLRAQSAPAAPASVVQIALGHSLVALAGPWKFHIGDNPKWADPNFDDSGWGTMDLTPPKGSITPDSGTSGWVPGWTAHGYKDYFGYAWYRLRVNIQSGRTALALKMPDDFDDAYQVYVNGQMIGQFGRFSKYGVTFYESQPRAFPLPAHLRGGPITIAIRMWMAASTELLEHGAGGLHGPPVLGRAGAIAGWLQIDWDAIDRMMYSAFFEVAILLLALGVAISLFWLDRTESAYLWLGLACVAMLARVAAVFVADYSLWIDKDVTILAVESVFIPATIGLWVLFWTAWFRLGGMARMHRMIWSLVALLGLGTAMLSAPLYGGVVPVSAVVWLSPLTLILKLLLGVLLVWVTVRGIRKDKFEGWLALPAVVLVAISLYQRELRLLYLPHEFFLFGVAFFVIRIATIVPLLIITVLLLRRFLRAQREREQWKLEIEQARQVQQLLVPVTPPDTPGFAVESVYLPVQKVGGDFFQVRPGGDGSLLVVVGDVSGKGLKAAMTVSTIVGALRGCALRGPADVLAYLNRVLYGEVSGFVTCCATLITSDGAMSIANAGHLSPYRNGEELAVESNLPLGIFAEGSYEEMQYQLAAGDRLTFMSDGVVEATNEKRELFGFERTQQISIQPAAAIADTSKAFGQQDDITVVTVTCTANLEVAIA